MRTVVFRAPAFAVERVLVHLDQPKFKGAGRLTAVQSPDFEALSEAEFRRLIGATGLVVECIDDRSPFD